MATARNDTAVGGLPRRLFHYNLGFLRDPHLRRVLALKGAPLALGLPSEGDGVAVWGRSPYAARGEAVAAKTGAPLIRIEDGFLRSIRPGRGKGAARDLALSYLIDPVGVHFDGAKPSMIERLCATHPLDDAHLLTRARDGIARLKALHLSKYNLHDPALAPPKPGYVLILDQTANDASIRFGAASARTFRELLGVAEIENPGARILIKTHPETALGLRAGHYGAEVAGRAELYTDPVSPWLLLEGAIAVYSVSSLMGYEAIFADHKPRIFGQPFYAGWGLTADENAPARRERKLTRAQIFAVSHILAPTYYDPCRDRICEFEDTLDQLEAEARAFRADRDGYIAGGMSRWKRPHLRQFFGHDAPITFTDTPPDPTGPTAPLMWWASKLAPDTAPDIAAKIEADGRILIRIEDGFIRSRGLGAQLIPPLSLVTDATGIYYDPSHPSDLETLIAAPCPPWAERRAERLIAALTAQNLSKYNLSGTLPDLPEGHRILVPGQVEDDASIRTAAGEINTNLALLQAARKAHPTDIIVYKPHPDVETGLRAGRIAPQDALRYADLIADDAPAIALINACDEVFTMTSLMGFEALLRGKRVTCTGMPFYAGWGLTKDLAPAPLRRQARPTLLALAYAALIAYPRYLDPITRRPCPAETAIERLATGMIPARGPFNRITAKLQGWLSDYAHLWR